MPPLASFHSSGDLTELLKLLNEYVWDSSVKTHYFSVVGSTIDKTTTYANTSEPTELQTLSNLEKKLYVLAKRIFPDLVAAETDCRVELVHEYSGVPVTVRLRGGKNIAEVLYERYKTSLFPNETDRRIVEQLLTVKPAYEHFWVYAPLKRIPRWHPSVRFPYDAPRNQFAGATWICADALIRMSRLCSMLISGIPRDYDVSLGLGAMTFLMCNNLTKGNECAQRFNAVYNHVYSQCLFVPPGLHYEVSSEYARNRRALLCGDVGELSKTAIAVLGVELTTLLDPMSRELRFPPFVADALLRFKARDDAEDEEFESLIRKVLDTHLFSLPNSDDVIRHLVEQHQPQTASDKSELGWIECKPSPIISITNGLITEAKITPYTYRPFLYFHPPQDVTHSHFAASLYGSDGKDITSVGNSQPCIPLTVSESLRVLYALIVPVVDTAAATTAAAAAAASGVRRS